MFDVPGSNITEVLITEDVVMGEGSAQYITADVEEAEEESPEDGNENFSVEESESRTTA